MVRQTRIYLAGAVSGTALIVMAIAAFVAVVSLQALRDWPLAGLGGSGDPGSVSVSSARPAGGEAAPGGQRLGTAAGARAARVGGRNAPHRAAAGRGGSTAATGGSTALTGTPAGVRGGAGGDSTQAAAGSQPSSPAGGGAAASGAGGGSGGGSTGGGGGGGSGGGPAPGGEPAGAPKLSETVTGTVDQTVTGVDEATGGALGETGLPKLTEEVVEGVAGPESTVGGTLDHTVEAVGGLLGGGR